MKIGIIADTHLGVTRFQKYHGLQNKVNFINSRAVEEGFEIFKQRGVDKIIHGGDLFDSPSPDVISILEANQIMDNLDIDTTVIGGNHDYSKKIDVSNKHVFDLMRKDGNVKYYAHEAKIEEYEDVLIAYVPYKALGDNAGSTFKYISESIRNSDKYKILVFHGSIDYEGSMHNPEYDMPMEIVQMFDFITMGHVHVPSIVQNARNKIAKGLVETDDVFHLTPGSTIPSPRATEETRKPSVYILDTETGDLEPIQLKSSYKILEYVTNNINDVLFDISEGEPDNLHIIEYNDAMSLIDESLYLKATQNSIKILIRNNVESNKVKINKVEEFWAFIEKKHPDLLEELKEVKDERV